MTNDSNPRRLSDLQTPPQTPPRIFLVLPAAGSGKRMQAGIPKQYLQVLGVPLLAHTLTRLGAMPWFSRIVIALAEDDSWWPSVEAVLPNTLTAKLLRVTGGDERCQSVAAALTLLAGEAGPDDWVLVHDAVRPCVLDSDVRKLIDALYNEKAGGLLAVPVQETLKEGTADQHVARTVDRSQLWRAVTPQMFRYEVLRTALQSALAAGVQPTDEAAAVERLGLPVRLVAGRADNIKVTWPEDLALVTALLTTDSPVDTGRI